MGKPCWSQTVLESGSLGQGVLQKPAVVQLETISRKQVQWSYVIVI